MFKILSQNSGYTVLLGVVIVGAAALSTVLTLSQVALNSVKYSRVLDYSVRAQNSADFCAEEALRRIQNDRHFTGDGTMDTAGSECNYNVEDLGSEVEVRVVGKHSESHKYIKINIPKGELKDLEEYSWQEVPDLEL